MNENNDKKPKQLCLMSLRTENVGPMFDDRTKQYEFRTWFPWNFKGRIFVYESGPNSKHKVVGFFDTRQVFTLEYGKPWPKGFQPYVDKTCPQSLMELNDVSESLQPGKRICVIPVFAPRRMICEKTLAEFNRAYGVKFAQGYDNPRDRDLTRPPMSWRLIEANYDGEDDAYPPMKRRQ